jgi:hypothetical protein
VSLLALKRALPVSCRAGVLVFLEFHTHHVEELIRICTQVMHQVHEVLHCFFHNDCTLEMNKKREDTETHESFLLKKCVG